LKNFKMYTVGTAEESLEIRYAQLK